MSVNYFKLQTLQKGTCECMTPWTLIGSNATLTDLTNAGQTWVEDKLIIVLKIHFEEKKSILNAINICFAPLTSFREFVEFQKTAK